MNFFDAMIAVQCSDPSHEGKTVRVKSYERDAYNGHWGQGASGAWNKQRPLGPTKQPWPKPYADMLVGETLIETVEQRQSLDPDNSRIRKRHTLECQLCGLKVDAREETFYPILDRVADYFVAAFGPGGCEIELSHLAAIITKASRGA